jgi:hypothetical protein
MSNRAIWNVRKRHEWLAKPLKGKRLKLRKRSRIGLQDAIERRQGESQPEQAAEN